MNADQLIAARSRGVSLSGIRRIFQLAGTISDPINLSIGQPDFPPPDEACAAARDALASGANGYTMTQGAPALLERVNGWLETDLGWRASVAMDGGTGPATIITGGTSGALTLAFLCLLDAGDECVIPDPYFVSYPHLATMAGARAVRCDTYPDFRMTADRVEPLLSERTKFVLLNAPSNPCGTVLSREECGALLELCRSRGVLLISDEIYDEFCYPEGLIDAARGDESRPRCPSPARFDGAEADVLLIRGFGKTYGVTGWRLGYCAGPRAIVDEMAKMQQYTFVCAPAPLQHGAMACFEADMSEAVAEYARRRDLVLERLAPFTEVTRPAGAFYAFVKVPEHLGLSGTAFVERLVERRVLTIPGAAFSDRDTHFRVSFATKMDNLERGLAIIAGEVGRDREVER